MADAVGAAPSAAPAGAPGNAAQGQVAAGPKPGESAAQAQARMLKLQLDGQEVELPESQVVANYRKGLDWQRFQSKAENARQEALKAKAAAEGLLSKLKSDPRSALRELGVDLRRISEETILEEINLEKMTPAERRAHELEQKLKAHEAEKAKAEEEKQRTVYEQEVARHKDEFANLFMETMERTGLPKSSGRYVVGRMAQLYAQNEAAGLESSPEEMAAHVMRGLEAEHRGVLSGLEGEALLNRLGPEVTKKVLAAHLARLNKARAAASGGGVQPAAKPAPPLQKPANADPRKGRWAAIEEMMRKG